MGLLSEDANARRVIRALVKYHHFTEAEAQALLAQPNNARDVDTATRLRSMVYYPLDKILARTTSHDCDALKCIDEEPDEDET